MKLEELTWEEVKEFLKKNQSLIIPIGTCEQHSTHLPLNADTLVSEKVAEDVAKEKAILIAPTITYGVNLPCDIVFSGTTTTTENALRTQMQSLLTWWKKQGFKKFYALSAHGDPIHLQALKESDPDVQVFELYDFPMKDILTKQEFTRHADESETSVLMYLFPEKVRKDKIVDFETPTEEFIPYLFHKKIDPIPGSPGCQGYPSFATVEKGERLYKRMVETVLQGMK